MASSTNSFDREKKWAIFEDSKFIKEYASSVEEARRYIVIKARVKLAELNGELSSKETKDENKQEDKGDKKEDIKKEDINKEDKEDKEDVNKEDKEDPKEDKEDKKEDVKEDPKEDECQTKPLWCGEEPELRDTIEPQYFMFYGLPGPNMSVIKIVKYLKIKGWMSTTVTNEEVYCIKYEPIYRVRFNKRPVIKETPVEADVKSEMYERKKFRDPDNPWDVTLSAIETGNVLKSVKKKQLNYTRPLPPLPEVETPDKSEDESVDNESEYEYEYEYENEDESVDNESVHEYEYEYEYDEDDIVDNESVHENESEDDDIVDNESIHENESEDEDNYKEYIREDYESILCQSPPAYCPIPPPSHYESDDSWSDSSDYDLEANSM